MASYSLTHSIPFPRSTLLNFPRIAFKLVWIAVFIIFLFLLIFYIFQVHTFVKEGYLVTSYEKELKELKEESKILEINFAKTSSLENIEEKINSLNFVKTEKIKYIQVLGTQVATK